MKATDAENTRALVDLTVRYAYWGYQEHLVLVREGRLWKLHLVVQGRIDHRRPVEAEEGR